MMDWHRIWGILQYVTVFKRLAMIDFHAEISICPNNTIVFQCDPLSIHRKSMHLKILHGEWVQKYSFFLLFRRLRWCWWQNVCWRRQKFKCMSVKFVCKNFSICWWSYQHTISYIFTDIVFNQHIFHQHPSIRSCMLVEVYQHKGFSSTSEHQQRHQQPFFGCIERVRSI